MNNAIIINTIKRRVLIAIRPFLLLLTPYTFIYLDLKYIGDSVPQILTNTLLPILIAASIIAVIKILKRIEVRLNCEYEELKVSNDQSAIFPDMGKGTSLQSTETSETTNKDKETKQLRHENKTLPVTKRLQ